MERILEQELMDDAEQALAYHNADFSASHGRRVEVFRETFPGRTLQGPVLDLGCGSGDILFRFLRAFPDCNVVGVDGSRAMLDLARRTADADPDLRRRVTLVEGYIPGAPIPRQPYTAVMAHSFLHHLHDPRGLWETVKEYAPPGALLFISDLRRPASHDEAQRIIDERAAGEPEVLRRDFYNSLCAAFTPDEVADQVRCAGLSELRVHPEGDIHLIVSGVRANTPAGL
jgi:SAM-dependent methyltransferase